MKKWAFIFIIFLLVGCKKDSSKYYDQMKKDIEEETLRYLSITAPNCSMTPIIIDEESLIVQAGMDKKKLLDIDNQSYCKVTIKSVCDESSKWQLDIKLSCRDYEDEGYIDWGN